MTHPRWRFAVLALAGGAVLAWLAWHSRTDLVRVLGGVSPYWIAASLALGVVLNALYGLLLDCVLTKYSGRPHPLLHTAVYLMSQPGKYVPGKLWQAVMQSIVLGEHSGVAAVGIANIELSLAAVLHATGLGLAALFAGVPALALAAAMFAVAASWALLRFPSGRLLLARFPRLRGWLRASEHDTHAPAAGAFALLLLTLAVLAVNGAASWSVLAAANTSLQPLQMAHLLACLWLGVAAALLALPVPAGIGVREAAAAGLGVLLAPDVPANVLISVALLGRCWALLVDGLSVVAGWLLWHFARRAPAR